MVEDERAVRELLQVHLQNAGFGVIAMPDAVEAGRALIKHAGKIHLMIVDAQLPYMSGIEFASTVIADTTLPSIPIVLITGHEHLASRAEIMDVPCLVKPFSAEDLVRVVGEKIATRGAAAGIGHATRAARAQAKGAA